MPETLTPLERRVYHYLLDFLAENTYQPSVRDICRRFGIRSTKTVADIFSSLDEKGFIQRDGGRSRGVRLLGYSSIGQVQPVPLYTRVNATEPRLAEGDRERFIAMDRAFVPADDAYFLRVGDGAMADRGIYRGDLVLVNPSARARDGDSIAVRLGEESLVRVLAHRGAYVALTPAAADEREVVVGPEDDFEVLGVVAAVLRSLQEGAPETRGNGMAADVAAPSVEA